MAGAWTRAAAKRKQLLIPTPEVPLAKRTVLEAPQKQSPEVPLAKRRITSKAFSRQLGGSARAAPEADGACLGKSEPPHSPPPAMPRTESVPSRTDWSKPLFSKPICASSNTQIFALPRDLLSYIFTKLPPNHVARSCALTCSAWSNVVKTSSLWRVLCTARGLTHADACMVLGGWRGLYARVFATNLISFPHFQGADAFREPDPGPFDPAPALCLDTIPVLGDPNMPFRLASPWCALVPDHSGSSSSGHPGHQPGASRPQWALPNVVRGKVSSVPCSQASQPADLRPRAHPRNTRSTTRSVESSRSERAQGGAPDSLAAASCLLLQTLNDVAPTTQGSSEVSLSFTDLGSSLAVYAKQSGAPTRVLPTDRQSVTEARADPTGSSRPNCALAPGCDAIFISSHAWGALSQSISLSHFPEAFLDSAPPLLFSIWTASLAGGYSDNGPVGSLAPQVPSSGARSADVAASNVKGATVQRPHNSDGMSEASKEQENPRDGSAFRSSHALKSSMHLSSEIISYSNSSAARILRGGLHPLKGMSLVQLRPPVSLCRQHPASAPLGHPQSGPCPLLPAIHGDQSPSTGLEGPHATPEVSSPPSVAMLGPAQETSGLGGPCLAHAAAALHDVAVLEPSLRGNGTQSTGMGSGEGCARGVPDPGSGSIRIQLILRDGAQTKLAHWSATAVALPQQGWHRVYVALPPYPAGLRLIDVEVSGLGVSFTGARLMFQSQPVDYLAAVDLLSLQ